MGGATPAGKPATREYLVDARVYLQPGGAPTEYSVEFTSPNTEFWLPGNMGPNPLSGWKARYWGELGAAGNLTINIGKGTMNPEQDTHHRSMLKRIVFLFPERTLIGAAGLFPNIPSDMSRWLFLQAFYKNYKEQVGHPPPCGSETRKFLFRDPDAFRKASHMEPLGFDPTQQELYRDELELWETWTLLTG
jgi:hypothetical protein